MKRVKLEEMSDQQLLERFVAIALEQDQAILYDDNARYNRLYDRMGDVRQELKSRPGDGRRALTALFNHPNAQVRLKAAITTLVMAREAARTVLQEISDRHEYPQAADARGMLRALDEGTYTPS